MPSHQLPFSSYPRKVYGVDFSGAVDAGRKTWVAGGVIERNAFRIEGLGPAAALPGSGRNRDQCLPALREFIERQQACVFGLDFPFGLPRELLAEASWEEFVLAFSRRYHSPEEFRSACLKAAGGSELKRVTDRDRKTPFSAYNIRLYRQTYFGIRDVLHPLVLHRLACVLPMQTPQPERPWILEICPASVLKQANLYAPYKGATDSHRARRARILEEIMETQNLLVDSTRCSVVLDDRGGDALDSIVAALAGFRALQSGAALTAPTHTAYTLEGYVYA
ncbi:MAG: DUF429 domain-containing protein [Candidatus Methylomirabilia bacterium]